MNHPVIPPLTRRLVTGSLQENSRIAAHAIQSKSGVRKVRGGEYAVPLQTTSEFSAERVMTWVIRVHTLRIQRCYWASPPLGLGISAGRFR